VISLAHIHFKNKKTTMKRISLLLLAATVAFASCKEQWKKGEEGMQYKVIAEGKGDKIQKGQFLELTISTVWNNGKKDSILNGDNAGTPIIVGYDSLEIPSSFYKMFKDVRKGDSLATKISTDSAFKKMPDQMPPFMKKGQMVFTNIRIVNIYKTKEEADKAREAAAKVAEEKAKAKSASLVGADDKTLNDYFAKNNIKAVKTPNGSYVEIIQPGTGPNMDTTSVAKLNYTGKILNGGEFDSNTDPSKPNHDPLIVNLTSDPGAGMSVIPGMTEALKLFNKGAKGKMYIPSGQAYGAQARGADLPANSILVFDIEVLDVLNKQQAKAEVEVLQKKYMEMQRQQQAMQQAMQQQQQQQAAPAQK
jgi:FKBP-type peptidyl-prolyl cis-trans isomerase FkpA